MTNRFRGDGLYILDEPEAALSPNRQLSLLAAMHDLVDVGGIRQIAYEETDHYRTTRDFLDNRERYFKHLFAEPETD